MGNFSNLDKLGKLLKDVKGQQVGNVPHDDDTPGEPGQGEPKEGQGDQMPDFEKSWAEMVEEEFPEGERLKEKIQDLGELFKKLLKKDNGEQEDPERVKSLMFILELAVEGLVRDFIDGLFVDFKEVKEEDVYRLRRFVREAAAEFTR